MEPLPIPLIKETYNGKSNKYFGKIELFIYPTSTKSNLYGFKMSLFDHGKPEEFLLIILSFNMTLAATWTLDMDAKIQYLCTVVCGEELRQFDLLSADI